MNDEDDNFNILKNLTKKEQYDFFNSPKKSETRDECIHRNIIYENVTKICTECGVVIDKDLSYEKEWRYYGMMDTKHSSDPNRCSMRKTDDKSIFKDVEKMGFSDKIISY